MTKTYEILLNGTLMSEYSMGLVDGIITAVTGGSSYFDFVCDQSSCITAVHIEDATEEQIVIMTEHINRLCPDIYAGVRVVE